MKVRWVFAVTAALAVAAIPAVASASTVPVTYTHSYAGYYANAASVAGQFPVVAFQATVTLPYFSQLAKATTGVSEEVRLYSTQGVTSMQLGADPQTATAWKPKMEYNGSTQVACNGSAFPQGDVVTEDGGVNSGTFTEDYPDIGIEFYDTAGRYAYCDYYPFGSTQDWFSTPPYSRISFVDGFNVKGFHLPPSPVAATSFSAVSVFDNATSQTLPLGTYPHGKFIATSTGSGGGVVWERPSALNSAGNGFSAVLP